MIAAVGPRCRPPLDAEPLLDTARPAVRGGRVIHDHGVQLGQADAASERDRLVIGALIELAVAEQDEDPRVRQSGGPQAEGGADGRRRAARARR